MKKIFSVFCALAVAISVPLLAYNPKVAHASANEGAPYLVSNDAYLYDTNLVNQSNTSYAYLTSSDFDYILDDLGYSSFGTEYSYQNLYQFLFLNGIPFEYSTGAGVSCALYSQGVEVNSSYHAYMLPIASVSLNTLDTVLAIFACPTVVPLTVENPWYSHLPYTLDNVFDIYVMRYYNGSYFFYYYYWAMYYSNNRLWFNVFAYGGNTAINRLVGYMPALSNYSSSSTVNARFSVAEVVTDLNFNPISVQSEYANSSSTFGNDLTLNIHTRNDVYGQPVEPFYNFDCYPSTSVNFLDYWFSNSFLARYNFSTLNLSKTLGLSYSAGYERGYNAGVRAGYDNGFNNGYNQGYTEGADLSGLANIKAQEYNRGFQDGMARAEQNGGSFGFVSLITTIADSQLMLLSSFLDFNFLGFNMLTFFKSILTVCVVIIVLKFVL